MSKPNSIANLARELGLTRQALHARLRRMPEAQALRDAEGRKRRESRLRRYILIIDGVELSTETCAQIFEVSVRQVRRWVKLGLVECRAPLGKRKCSVCGTPGHYRSSPECPGLHTAAGEPTAPPPASAAPSSPGVE